MRNPQIILAALHGDALNHRVDERIIPSAWSEDESCDLPNSGWVTFSSNEPFREEDYQRVYEFIEKMDEAIDVMRPGGEPRP